MITGQVTPFREATIRIELVATDGKAMVVDAVIDTGFTDYLTGPAHLISALGLPLDTFVVCNWRTEVRSAQASTWGECAGSIAIFRPRRRGRRRHVDWHGIAFRLRAQGSSVGRRRSYRPAALTNPRADCCPPVSPAQGSYGSPDWKHGAFTLALLRSLDNPNLEYRGSIRFGGLANGVAQEVQDLLRAAGRNELEQTPNIPLDLGALLVPIAQVR